MKEAEEAAVALTQALAQHLHGLLQLREQEAIHSLRSATTSLHCDLAMKVRRMEALGRKGEGRWWERWKGTWEGKEMLGKMEGR